MCQRRRMSLLKAYNNDNIYAACVILYCIHWYCISYCWRDLQWPELCVFLYKLAESAALTNVALCRTRTRTTHAPRRVGTESHITASMRTRLNRNELYTKLILLLSTWLWAVPPNSCLPFCRPLYQYFQAAWLLQLPALGSSMERQIQLFHPS